MQIQDQVTSLELSKRLKELGVKQESLFYWCNFGKDDWRGVYYNGVDETLTYAGTSCFEKDECRDLASAFTVAELGEMLPCEVTPKEIMGEKQKPKYLNLDTFIEQVNDFYGVERIWRVSIGSIQFKETSEADARAKMLIYLLENKLI